MGNDGGGVLETIDGEVRLSEEGGIAHFPGRARGKVMALSDLPVSLAREIVYLAEDAGLFDRTFPPQGLSRPDARTYTIAITVGDRSGRACVTEPIDDMNLVALLAAVRRSLSRLGPSG
jgi:hypothetical protein